MINLMLVFQGTGVCVSLGAFGGLVEHLREWSYPVAATRRVGEFLLLHHFVISPLLLSVFSILAFLEAEWWYRTVV